MLFEDEGASVFTLGVATSRLLELSTVSGFLGSGNATALSCGNDDSVRVDSDELRDFFCNVETVLLYDRKEDSFL